MTEDKEDRELNEIVQHAKEQAESLYPKRDLSWKVRLGLVIAAILLFSNSILSGVNTAFISDQKDCIKAQANQIATVRSTNSDTTKAWINSVTTDLDAAFKGTAKFTQVDFDKITATYNASIDAGNAKIKALQAQSCN